jgi:hypothetical protein
MGLTMDIHVLITSTTTVVIHIDRCQCEDGTSEAGFCSLSVQ